MPAQNEGIIYWLFLPQIGSYFVTKEERATKGVIYREDN